MKYLANFIFIAILVAVIGFGIVNSISNQRVSSSSVNELLFNIKLLKQNLITKKSLRQLSEWEYRLRVLKDSLDAEMQPMTSKEFLQLRDSIDGYVPVKMSDEEKEKLHLDFQRETTEEIQDSIIGEVQMTAERFEAMFGCKPDSNLL